MYSENVGGYVGKLCIIISLTHILHISVDLAGWTLRGNLYIHVATFSSVIQRNYNYYRSKDISIEIVMRF